jgi:rubrerythrin
MAVTAAKTEANLRAAFAREAANCCRYLYFARRADVEGLSDIAAMFRDIAQSESSHAFGLLELLETITGDASEGSVAHHLASAQAAQARDSQQTYPRLAAVAREEGFEDIAAWFELVAEAEARHATAFAAALGATADAR